MRPREERFPVPRRTFPTEALFAAYDNQTAALIIWLKPGNPRWAFPQLYRPVLNELFRPLLGIFQARAMKIDAGNGFVLRSQLEGLIIS